MQNINWPGWVSCVIALGSLIYTGWLHRRMNKEKNTVYIPVDIKRHSFIGKSHFIMLTIHQMPRTEYITSISVKNGLLRKSSADKFVEKLVTSIPIPGLDVRPRAHNRLEETRAFQIEIFLFEPSEYCTFNFTLASGRIAAETTVSLIN